MIFFIIGWIVYCFIVAGIARWLHPGDDPVGFLSTMIIGVAGSFIGGSIGYFFGYGDNLIQSSGIIFGIIGSIIALVVWRWWNLRNNKDGPKNFWTGK